MVDFWDKRDRIKRKAAAEVLYKEIMVGDLMSIISQYDSEW
jgi:hypothetical protein